jgi:murein L,D-transpeptidase YafK
MNWRDFMALRWRGAVDPPAMAPVAAQADMIEIHKGRRLLELKRDGEAFGSYRIALGFAPQGHKEREGDGRTPEGEYRIDARNPRSAFHLSLRISYPRPADSERAAALGVPPGGDVYIHGLPNGLRKWFMRHPGRDWTSGCVAVTDREIRTIWSLVPTGVRVVVHP